MKEAVESLLPLERNLFFALNGSDSIFLDNVMWTLSGRFVWIPLFLFIIFIMFYKINWKGAALVAVFFILVFVLSDQVSSSLFKPLFERFRPTHHPDFMNLVDTVNNYRGGRFGFISSHATNAFGLAVFLSLIFKSRLVTLSTLIWATLNSYTRLYLGVHFISDILAGAIVGSILAVLLFTVYTLLYKAPVNTIIHTGDRAVYSSTHAKNLSLFILIYTTLLIIFSPILATLPH
ncbi:MAG: phosphatase PAP2 family protein [Fermentimonas sp.]|nr:phosphatase PAP2 family protein [Fermentimonas sp.]